MQLITKHLDSNLLTCKIHQINTICAFSGQKITQGILFKDIIGERFTDLEIFKYKSDYLSIDFALLTQPVIKGDKQLNSLRNYSFFASDNHFKLLQRNEILDLILNIPQSPFHLAVTYSYKKHISYKAPLNYNNKNFIVATDTGIVEINHNKLKEILPICEKWYTIAKNTTQEPTFFTKDEILGLQVPNSQKIQDYGIEKYFKEYEILSKYHKTQFLKFIVHILNKKTC